MSPILNSLNSEKTILSMYVLAKNIGLLCLKIRVLNLGYFLLHYACSLARRYPILYNYCDDDIEEALAASFRPSVQKESSSALNDRRVVFYNSYIIDRGALTQQYLTYFIEQKYEILLVVRSKEASSSGQDIIRQIKEYKKGTLIIDADKKLKSKITQIYKVINDYAASNIFIQLGPEDVVGFTALANISLSKKYYIVHNDHTFWLGKNCADYFLEFRPFGINIAAQRRKIAMDKIILNKFYPIVDEKRFEGFPIAPEGKVIGFMAANLYKLTMDKELRILKSIVNIIKLNSNFIFFLAGFGNSKPIISFIKRHNIQNQFIFLGKRSDFAEVVSNCHILIGTYPMAGGLVTQYAALFNKKIISYTSKDIYSLNYLEDLLSVCNERLTYTDLEEFERTLNRLIKENANDSNNYVAMTKELFTSRMDSILNNSKLTIYKKPLPDLEHSDNTYFSFYKNNGDFVLIDFIKHVIKTLKKNISK